MHFIFGWQDVISRIYFSLHKQKVSILTTSALLYTQLHKHSSDYSVQQYLYVRYFKRPLKFFSFEKEAGLAEPEPEITLAIKKADSTLSSAMKSVASRLTEVIPVLSSALV